MLAPTKILSEADFISGTFLLVDKPKGWTSFDAVNKIKNLVRRKYDLKKFKIGHSGTLDPMATGLLLICTGGLTKELHFLQGLDKKYAAEITLGIETDSYDAEGVTVFEKDVPSLSNESLQPVIQSFKGEFDQIPPVFSAIKKEGTPLYALARAGKEVTPAARRVIVHDICLKEFNSPLIKLEVHCGSGFYVRSLAHDIGEQIGCGGHLSALSRTAVGSYELTAAFKMDDIIKYFQSAD